MNEHGNDNDDGASGAKDVNGGETAAAGKERGVADTLGALGGGGGDEVDAPTMFRRGPDLCSLHTRVGCLGNGAALFDGKRLALPICDTRRHSPTESGSPLPSVAKAPQGCRRMRTPAHGAERRGFPLQRLLSIFPSPQTRAKTGMIVLSTACVCIGPATTQFGLARFERTVSGLGCQRLVAYTGRRRRPPLHGNGHGSSGAMLGGLLWG